MKIIIKGSKDEDMSLMVATALQIVEDCDQQVEIEVGFTSISLLPCMTEIDYIVNWFKNAKALEESVNTPPCKAEVTEIKNYRKNNGQQIVQ